MRIVVITAGTGSFHCGSCMRDNALVAELCRQGHDALLVPLYLPMVLDEDEATPNAPLFYGGINVYLQQKTGLFQKTPRVLDKVLDSPGLLRAAAGRAGMTSARELGQITVSMLSGEDGRQVKELDKLTDWLHKETPDVVCLSNALLIGLTRQIKHRTGAPVVCTLQGEDYFLDGLPESYRFTAWEILAERAAEADHFIAVSHYYGDVMRRRATLAPGKVTVVHNGIVLDGYGPASSPPDPPVLGYLARMCALKGLGTLIEAFILLKGTDRIPGLKLRVAGSQTATDREYVSGLQKRLANEGLADDAEFLPNIEKNEKIAFLQSLSVLSVPATYGESFGLYVIEALAAGVPVVQPRHAAFPELIEMTGGGLLCEPDDPQSLADRIVELLSDPGRAREMGENGRQVVFKEFSVQRMADNVLSVLAGVSNKAGKSSPKVA